MSKIVSDRLVSRAPKIIPCVDDAICTYKTGSLHGLTKAQLETILEFQPNMEVDQYKVRWQYGFTIGTVFCAIWDWKGSADFGDWSTFGEGEVLKVIFGNNYSDFAF